MDRLHLLTVFIAVADSQGFASAARQLELSPPAVTRAIAALEASLGVRLLTRTTRRVRLTEAGERYVEDCRRILGELAEADASASGQQATPRGRLAVTAPAVFGRRFVTPLVVDYLQRYPEVAATCWFVDRVVDLVDEGVDVGVRLGHLPDSTLQAVRVGEVRRVVCASPAYLRAHGTPRLPADLATHAIVSASAVTRATSWRLGGPRQQPIDVPLQPRLVVSTNDAAVAAAEAGFGIARLMSYQVAEAVRAGRLRLLLAGYEEAPLPVHLVHREGRHASAKARSFLDLAIQRLRAEPDLAPGALARRRASA